MPTTNAINLIAVSLLLGMGSPALAQPPMQYAQAQQTPSQMEQDYQNRLRAAKTPEERARIQAEHDRMMQQGAVPDTGAVRTGPQPDAPGALGGGNVPRGQRDSGGADSSTGGGSGTGGSSGNSSGGGSSGGGSGSGGGGSGR
jgi:hypothetical protein